MRGILSAWVLALAAVGAAAAQGSLRGKVFAPEDHTGHNHAPGEHVGKTAFDPLPGATVMW